MAFSSSGVVTKRGVIVSDAGAVSEKPAHGKKIVSNNTAGLARPNETSVANAAIAAMMAISTTMRIRRESMMSSQRASGQREQNDWQAGRHLNQGDGHRISVEASHQPS
jgi:hypothetical protein